jgi:hypothetical protein
VKALAVIALVCGAAAADPCKPAGGVLFQIAYGPIGAAKADAWTVKLHDNGAWTRDETTADGKPGSASAGCLDKSELARIQDDLKAATWKTKTARIKCMARTSTHTVFSVNDKPVFTEETCSGVILDDASAKSLADIRKILDKAIGKP